jgi:hypothetical protein
VLRFYHRERTTTNTTISNFGYTTCCITYCWLAIVPKAISATPAAIATNGLMILKLFLME